MEKKTKIVCTIGPATESQEQLEKLLKVGLNVIRLNFSHGDFAEHQRKVDNGRAASAKTGIPVAFLQDLSGPKIRIGTFYNDPARRITLKAGQKFTLTTDAKVEGTEEIVYLNYEKLPLEAKKGEAVLLDDGKVRMVITDIKGNNVICKVMNGAEIKGKRGVNLPESDLSISALTPKDKKDIDFGIANNVDYVAFSFVRKASEAIELRKILNKRGLAKAKIIAKIETPQALTNFDEILNEVEGIMVARGDLAVEIPAEKVPAAQKMMIEKANKSGKVVITATQMLESMIKSPVPTRAEVSDVANAIIDGTDAVMLSEETTLGAYPIEAVTLMSKVAREMENGLVKNRLLEENSGITSINGFIGSSAVRLSNVLGAKYIAACTNSGTTACMISRHKPSAEIVAFTPNQTTYNQLVMSWGVTPVLVKTVDEHHALLSQVRDYFTKNKLVKKGDKVVVISSLSVTSSIHNNTLTVETF